MTMSFEDQIRERAYHIWLSGGMADGQAHEHWVCAEQAMRGEAAEPEIILTKAPIRKAAAGTKKKAATKPASKAAVAKAPRGSRKRESADCPVM